jgi:hypothetical protein
LILGVSVRLRMRVWVKECEGMRYKYDCDGGREEN